MKRTIIFSAFLLVAIMTGTASAQSLNFTKVMMKQDLDPSGNEVATISFTGLEAPGLQLFESIVPAATEAECLATTTFPNPRPLGSDRATLVYDGAAGTYTLRWAIGRDRGDSCRVVLVGTTASSADYNLWRANFGRTSLTDEESGMDDGARAATYGRGIYQLSISPL